MCAVGSVDEWTSRPSDGNYAHVRRSSCAKPAMRNRAYEDVSYVRMWAKLSCVVEMCLNLAQHYFERVYSAVLSPHPVQTTVRRCFTAYKSLRNDESRRDETQQSMETLRWRYEQRSTGVRGVNNRPNITEQWALRTRGGRQGYITTVRHNRSLEQRTDRDSRTLWWRYRFCSEAMSATLV